MARLLAVITVLGGLAVGVTGCTSNSSPSKSPAPSPEVPGKDANTGPRKVAPPQ
jgi:hypothetical protein